MTEEITNIVWKMYLSKDMMIDSGVKPKEFMDTYFINCGSVMGYVLKEQYQFNVIISYATGCRMVLEGIVLTEYPEYPRESIYFKFNGRGCGVFNEQSRDEWAISGHIGHIVKRVCMFHQIAGDLSFGVCDEIKSCEIQLIVKDEARL